MLCSGAVGIGWHGKAGQGSSRYGAMWFGWRVMVRLGAVLRGSIMYGLARLAGRGWFRSGKPGSGLAGKAMLG